jgi:hypothetical protein
VLLLFVVCAPAFGAATQGGAIPVPLPLFPPNNWWNVDVSNAPVDSNSASFISFIGTTRGLHPDFGGDAGGGNVYGFPFIVVDAAQAKKSVDFVLYGNESDGDGVPFYPVPDEAITMNGWIEGGQPGTVDQRNQSDRHILIVDKANNHLYELYNVWHNGSNWEAGSGAFFDMNTNNRRPEGWTSADAAGLAILPGLVRYDEVFGADEIRHALRVTVRATNGHVFPASHTAGSTAGALPMGARLRLKASKNISGYAPEVQKIFRAMKKYGLIVADNGSDMYVSGVYDRRWNNDVLNPAFRSLTASDFEVVQRGWSPPTSLVLSLPANAAVGEATTATLTAYNSNFTVATGYTGTVQFTSTDGAATLPLNYTFTAGDQGTHTFPAGVTLRTPGNQIVTVRDVANATITGSDAVVVAAGSAASTPTGVVATATSTTQVHVSWNASSGAAQYQVYRGGTLRTTTASTSFVDASLAPNTSYVYTVRALDAAAMPTPLSAPDVATTIIFTEGLRILAVHITQLRGAVNAMRAAASLAPATFTDSVPLRIRAVHVIELRNALDPARAALGLAPIGYTDPFLGAGTIAKLLHVQQLRDGVR